MQAPPKNYMPQYVASSQGGVLETIEGRLPVFLGEGRLFTTHNPDEDLKRATYENLPQGQWAVIPGFLITQKPVFVDKEGVLYNDGKTISLADNKSMFPETGTEPTYADSRPAKFADLMPQNKVVATEELDSGPITRLIEAYMEPLMELASKAVGALKSVLGIGKEGQKGR